ncbi:MAG: ABC transporter permease [Acidimicrobiia bacterium]|nr:MAG: ABC transporter permease [Acidimicrobiia bacterium]
MSDASRLRRGDAARVAVVGLRTRTTRAILSALGITIGIASMVAVLGLSESSKSDLLSSLDRLGTNLLVVEAGSGIGTGTGTLTSTAEAMVDRIGPVEQVSAVGAVDAKVFRTDLVPETRSGGLSVQVAPDNLLATLGGDLSSGRFFDEGTDHLPVAVVGSVAAERLGITDTGGTQQIWLGGQWFGVIGVLDPLELAPGLDRAVIIGEEAAADLFDYDGIPQTLYVRAAPEHLDAVSAVLPATADPEAPDQVQVSRPTDALEARAAAEGAFTALFLGLGIVALVVGGVGVANVMVISVLERRGEIGLRRALGATRRHVAVQFVGESLILATAGGIAGVTLGAAVTAAYSSLRGWTVLIPGIALWGGLTAAILIGVVAGLYPARRAARLDPTEALRGA